MKKGKFKKFLAGTAMGVCALVMPFGLVGCTPESEINVRFNDNYFQWQFEGSTEWNNLLTIDEIKEKLGEGYQGIPGTDGKEVEFRKNETHIQWRYKTTDNSDTWKNLVALSEIKGEDGKTPYIGENGNWWIDDADTGVVAEGQNGINGKSAYEIYCSHKPNYKKSEVEWMNDFISGDLLMLPTSLGDVNSDGEVGNKDVIGIGKHIINESILDCNGLANADINADGVINGKDLRLLKNYVLYSLTEDGVEKIDPILKSFGDVNLDGVVNEDDYDLLTKANNDEVELTKEQLILSELDSQKNWKYSDDLEILRDYLDGKIENLDNEYHFITLDFDGYENINNIDTYFYVRHGDCISNLPTLAREGLQFNGWIPNYSIEVNHDTIITSTTPIERYMTLIPSWTDARPNISTNLELELKSNNTYSLKGLGTNTDTNLVIPAYHNGLKVSTLARFSTNNSTVTSIIIPCTVNNVLNGWLSACFENVGTVVVDENNKTFDSRNNCNAIIETATNKLVSACKGTIIPNTVTSIGDYSFDDMTINELVLNENISKISESCFDGAKIQKLIIKNTESVLGDWIPMFSGARITNLICDNADLANKNEDIGSILAGLCSIETIYFKEGLTVNTEFYFEFEETTSDLDGYVKYIKK